MKSMPKVQLDMKNAKQNIKILKSNLKKNKYVRYN